ncbi:hypothetical protein TrVFT333_004132 [Trichoderma virens FT-333]|nr:hypothetical protein TrVFT333_004132 [Trichoderma virens FT-333]
MKTGLVLGTGAFIQLAQTDNGGSEQTGELRMLEASRDEIRKTIDDNDRGASRIVQEILLFWEVYIWEPICTGTRFLHLVVIFVPVILSVPAIWFGRRHPDKDGERSGTLWWYGFLVKSMELAGPAFIKLGQWAASRTDIFPTAMCDTMSKLHSNAPAHSMRVTRRTVEEAFNGRNFEDIFDEFHETPLGVGAIAQVYKAKLKPDLAAPQDLGAVPKEPRPLSQNVKDRVRTVLKSSPNQVPSTYVAVKVLHPNVDRIVRRDLKIMGFFATLLNTIPTIEWLSLPDEVSQFGEMMKLQLDLRIEAANLETFRKNFSGRTTASFPFPYSEFTTRNVLIEEFAQGIPLADFMENGGPNLRLRRSRETPPTSDDDDHLDVTEQVLERLRPYRRRKDKSAWEAELAKIDAEGYRPQLIFIDTGLVTELNAVNRDNFLALFRAVAEFDGYKAGHLMCERCRQPEAVIDKEVFALKMQHLVLSVKSRTLALGNVKIGDILQEVLSMVRNHHVRLEGDFVNVVISILLLEGIGRSLNPNVDLLSSSLPILRQLSAQSGAAMAKHGDFSMIMLWMGLETRKFLQASVDDVERCVKYDLLSPNV